jgi:hypothetical protein
MAVICPPTLAERLLLAVYARSVLGCDLSLHEERVRLFKRLALINRLGARLSSQARFAHLVKLSQDSRPNVCAHLARYRPKAG